MFFLPLISYEDHQISNFFKGALGILGISFIQISFLQLENFVEFRLRALSLHFRSLGYWIEVPKVQTASTSLNGEIFEWNSSLNSKQLEKRLLVTFKGKFYRKVFFKGNYLPSGNLILKLSDRCIIVILKGPA